MTKLAPPAAIILDPRLEAARRGEAAATQSLLLEILPRVRNLARWLLRGDSHVDDVAQEALIAIVRGLPGYRGEGSFKSWTDRIVARVSFEWIRRLRRDRELPLGGPVELASVPHPDAAPDVSAARRELLARLDALPDAQRHALVLHHLLGMSVPEIAEAMAIPSETVRSRLRWGRQNFRALHDAGGDGEDEG